MPYHLLIGKIVGTLYLKIKSVHSEKFLSFCQEHKIIIWNVRVTSENDLECHIYLSQAKIIQQLIEEHHLSMEIIETKVSGLFPKVKQLLNQKAFIFIALFCLIFLFLISNIVWKVSISGVNIEQQEKIKSFLYTNGIKKGNFLFNLPKTEQVQNEILVNMDELLYVSIEKNGTTINVEAKEKKLTNPKVEVKHKQLIAKKSGLIDKMLIKHGFPVVQANDYVNKGDLLVINELKNEDKTSDNKINNSNLIVEGEVYANTWYEVTVSTPLSFTDEQIFGEMKKTYSMKIGKYIFPIWPLKQGNIKSEFSEREEIDIHFLQMNLPLTLIKHYIYNIKKRNIEQSVNIAKEYAIQQAINHLQLKLGIKTKVKHYFILQETVDNQNVKLNIFVSVVEDIAEGR